MRPKLGMIAGLTVVGMIVSLLAILILSERPDRPVERAAIERPGGVSVVEKNVFPPARDAAEAPSSAPQENAGQPAGGMPATPPLPIAVSAPGVPAPVVTGPAAPAVEPKPAVLTPPVAVILTAEPPAEAAPAAAAPAEPVPAEQPVAESAPAEPPVPARRPPAAPLPERKPATGGAAASVAAPSLLPWQTASNSEAQAVTAGTTAEQPQDNEASPAQLPSRSELREWVKSTAREFVGGVDAEGMPLYRFDVWLEAPKDVRAHVRKVSYAYLAPSVQPPEQSSDDPENGFRVKFGAAACAEKATVTLTLRDGRERQVDVDGCRILN
jgi:hypothetical protein